MQRPSDDTDEGIVSRVQGGDREAFGTIVERYEPKLTRYLRRFFSDPEDVRDTVQDVFVKAYVNLRGFDAARRFSPWIYRIAHNEMANGLKRKRTAPFSFFDFDTIFPHPVAPETAEGPAERREARELLECGLERLDVKYREPLALFYFEDMDYQSIADILEIPSATVGVRLARARALLRKLIEPHR